MYSSINVAMTQQRDGTINLWRLVYSPVLRNVQSFLYRLFVGEKRHSVIPLFKWHGWADGIQRIYPPRNKKVAQILLESPIFSIFHRNNFGYKKEKHYFCKWEKAFFWLVQNIAEYRSPLVSKSLPVKPTIFVSSLFSMSKRNWYVFQREWWYFS